MGCYSDIFTKVTKNININKSSIRGAISQFDINTLIVAGKQDPKGHI